MCGPPVQKEDKVSIVVNFKHLRARDFVYYSWYEKLTCSKHKNGILFWRHYKYYLSRFQTVSFEVIEGNLVMNKEVRNKLLLIREVNENETFIQKIKRHYANLFHL